MKTVQEFCMQILESGELEDKLHPPISAEGEPLIDRVGPSLHIDRPARAAALQLRERAGKLPRLNELGDTGPRAETLARFAHHELLAVELFAWALLRWPEAPAPLRRGWLITLQDEQRHLELYLDRLQSLGSRLSDHALSDYLWKHVPAIDASPYGPLAFLTAMGLTFEQANLDFSLLYRDAFRAVEDEASARVMQVVHDEEIGHVKLASHWLRQLKRPGQSDVGCYEEAVPFPLSAARAKGRRFEVGARRKAGLSEEMIEFVRQARPYGERGS